MTAEQDASIDTGRCGWVNTNATYKFGESTRFRRDLVKIPAEAPEGSVRFRRVPVQIPGSGERPCEVPEGFGGEDAW